MHNRDIKSQNIGPDGRTEWLMESEWAPCRYACPVHADVRTYIELAAGGDWRGAIDVVRRQLPFAAVCGRICHHPCEDNCRRGDVEAAVAIREVKRFVAETQGAGGASLHPRKQPTGKKAAVIGAGPSGMSAALELAKSGHETVVFDRAETAGGVPANIIPRYRLPAEVTRIDIDWICAHGVRLRLGVEAGADFTINSLLKDEGFDAVLIAVGLSSSRKLPIPGADHAKVYAVMDFLRETNLGRAPQVGDETVVIGAGDVAMDVARTAVRLGSRKVKILCLEDEDEIPAYEWEVREAREEGVEFIKRRGPVEILTAAGGAITAITARKVTRVFDDQGRFAPEYDDSDRIQVSADTVVFAIGQAPDPGYAAGDELELDGSGRPVWDPRTFRTSRADVFACGEIVTAPGSVVEACQSGKLAARAVDAYLNGRPIRIEDETPYVIDTLPGKNAENVIRRDRMPVGTLPPERRRRCFEPIDSTYPPGAAAMEARRCMSCGGGAEVLVDKCSACLTCLRVCPFDAPVITDVARVAAEGCQACGICEAECPSNAIVMRRTGRDSLKQKTAGMLEAGKEIIAYIGGFRASPADWRGEHGAGVESTGEIYLTSTASISVSDLLYAFGKGARGVILAPPKDGHDRYPRTAARTRRRVEQARTLLKEAGLDESRLRMAEIADEGRDALVRALESFAGELSKK